MTENELATLALDIAFKIHWHYGPGLFESVYEEIFCYGWQKTGISFLRQHPVSLIHETIKPDAGFRANVILDNKVIIELKSVEAFAGIGCKPNSRLYRLCGHSRWPFAGTCVCTSTIRNDNLVCTPGIHYKQLLTYLKLTN
jgi:GxxExxY protein